MLILTKFRRSLLLFAISLLVSQYSHLKSQCPITVNAGPDVAACAPSGTATLNGSVTGNFLGFNWDPIMGMSNPNSLNPTVTVTGTQTYTLTAAAEDPTAPNMVTNPGFELLNTGFTSSLTYTSTPISPGTYFITTSPAVVISNFPPCDDHTFGNGTGQMMLINGPAVAGTQVWCQTIPVMPNTWYSMSAWATASPISPPQLQFTVNGTPVGTPYTVMTNPCNWQQFSSSWFSGTATTAQLCIVDQNGSGNGLFGDDFALDDVYFGEACTVSDDVTVNLVDVDAMLDPTVELPCNALPAGMQLDGTGSTQGANISYQWTTGDGNIVSGANTLTPTINLEGTYTLTVTYSDGFTVCTDQASIQVLPDPNVVFAFIPPADELNCNNPTVTLNGAGASSGPTISYQWTPLTGIISGETTQFPVVNQGGTYTLTVTNSISGCTATASVNVFENFTAPTANAAEPGSISCQDTSLTLDGSGSSTGNEFTYLWTTALGNIASGETTLQPVVDAAGDYLLTVTNTQNGCTADTLVVVTGDTDPPTATAAVLNNLDCANPTAELDGTGSSTGGNFDYLWTTPNGNITSGGTTLSPIVDEEGDYLLTVTDSDNGCSAVDTVSVTENPSNYVVAIAQPGILTCATTSFELDASGTTQSADLTYLWTTATGSFAAGETTLNPEVNAPGTYILTLTDTLNGCTATDSVTVAENTTPPMADAGATGTIDCDADPIALDGSGSAGNDFSYLWTTTGGTILSGETTLAPEVNAAGTYLLTVTDQTNGCTAADSTAVTQVGDAPTVSIALPDTLDCLVGQQQIDASGSSSGGDILIEWTFTPPPGGAGGGIASGETTLTPTVDAGGTYTLTLTDTLTGCIGTGSVTVVQDTLAPSVAIAPPMVLTCLLTSDTLLATGSSQGGNFGASWTSPNGQILSGQTTYTPVIGTAGDYIFTLQNFENNCETIDTVTVAEDVAEPTAEAGTPQTLNCDVTSLELSGSGSSTGSEFTYLWTQTSPSGGGGVASGQTTLMPTVDAAGTYLLTVTDTLNGCTATDEVTIDESSDLPQAEILPADTLTCDVASLPLDGSGSSTGSDFTYLWSTSDGNLATGQTTLTPTVDAPGTYLLTVTDTTNGCMATAMVTVAQDGDLPTAEAGQMFTLSCLLPDAQLDGTGSSTVGVSYFWTTSNGNILSGETTLTPTINAAGDYLLTVTDLSNGCTATDMVTIDQDANAPVADAGLPDTLTCLLNSLTLDGSGSSQGANLEYLWTQTSPSGGGGIAAGQNTLTPTVDAPGTYLLTVTDQANSCQSIASVLIAEVTEGPEIIPGNSVTLTCSDTILSLNAQVLGNADLLWTTSNGEILSGETTLTPAIGSVGDYLLTATDVSSGCTSEATVIADEDVVPPVLIFDYPQDFACGETTALLDASGSSNGSDFLWNWTASMGGGVISTTDTTQLVSLPGFFELEITNLVNGCTAYDSVTLVGGGDAPTAIIAPADELTCLETLVTLDGSASSSGPGFELTWSTQDGNLASGQTTLTPQADAPGIYILIVENTANGCADTASVIVQQAVAFPGADAGAQVLLTCDEPEVALTGTSPTLDVEFAWTTADGNILFGADTPLPGVDAAGTYFLTVTNPDNGCTSMDSVEVVSTFLQDFSFENTNPNCLVPTGSITIGSVQGGVGWLEYSVDGGVSFASQNIFEGLPPGSYELVVQDSGGCELTAVAEILEPFDVEISLEPAVEVTLGESVRLEPQLNISPNDLAEIIWSPEMGLSCTGCLNPTVTPGSDGTYSVQVTDVNGCTASASVLLTAQVPNSVVYVPNAFSPNGDGVNDAFVIFGKPELVREVSSLHIFTRWGESVFENFNFPVNGFEHGWDGTHRGEKLDVGVYTWFAELELVNGEMRFVEGDVMILR